MTCQEREKLISFIINDLYRYSSKELKDELIKREINKENNMSKDRDCSFLNTSKVLEDCIDNWENEETMSYVELKSKEKIIELARVIIEIEK